MYFKPTEKKTDTNKSNTLMPVVQVNKFLSFCMIAVELLISNNDTLYIQSMYPKSHYVPSQK